MTTWKEPIGSGLVAAVVVVACGGDGETDAAGTAGTAVAATSESDGSDLPPTGDASSGAADETSTAAESTDGATTTDADTTGAPAECGNGVLEEGEECDEGVANGRYGQCAQDCSGLGPHCGDGIVNGDEACDELDEEDMDGCNTNCVTSLSPTWTLPTSPAEIYDLATAPDARLFVAGRQAGEGWAVSLDSDGTELDSVALVGPNASSSYVTGIAFGPGDAVWASVGMGLPSAGHLRRIFGADSLDYEFGLEFTGIATSADGVFVFATLSGGTLGIFRFDAEAAFEWLLPAPDPSTCQGGSSSRGPVITNAGDALFACRGTAGSWYVHHYSVAGDIAAVLAVDPPADIEAIAIDGADDLYFAGGGQLGAYVSRYGFGTGTDWTTLNPIEGNLTRWSDIQVSEDGQTVVVVGGTKDRNSESSVGAAARLTVDGEPMASSVISETVNLEHLALGSNGEIYAAGELENPFEDILMRLTP